MSWRRCLAITIGILALALPLTARAEEMVDLLLVLASDVSRSVDEPKFNLQRDGYATAFTNGAVLDAIRSGRYGRIAVAFVEWSGVVSQKLVVDWTLIGDLASAEQFGAKVRAAPRAFADRTSISAGIDFSMSLLERAPYASKNRTIDVSGDGTNNSGREVTAARDEALAKDVTINGLVILSAQPLPWNPNHTHPPGGLGEYYRRNVIGGANAFVMMAQNFEAFGRALIGKLVAEIAAASSPTFAARTR